MLMRYLGCTDQTESFGVITSLLVIDANQKNRELFPTVARDQRVSSIGKRTKQTAHSD